MSEIKPISTEADYALAMAEISHLWGAALGTPEGDRLDILATLIQGYEEKHFPMDKPNPIEALTSAWSSEG